LNEKELIEIKMMEINQTLINHTKAIALLTSNQGKILKELEKLLGMILNI